MVGDRAREGDATDAPERVGRFRLVEELGRGGMGVVFRGQADDGSPVAIKLLRAAAVSPTEATRFRREAQIRIDHPNLIRVLDAGVDEDVPWIAFELLEGEVLSSRLEREPLCVRDAVRIGADIVSGLAAAHEAGVVHRDLKPSNVFLCADGSVRVLDFGIALLDSSQTRLTATGSVLGTPTYLSPEQAHGARVVDARSDVWAMGVLLYEMLAGRPPFLRATPLSTVLAVMIEAAPPLGIVAPHVPVELAAIVARCLEKRPEERFADARALAEALAALDPQSLATDTTAQVSRASMATAETSLSAPVPAAAITPGEQRVVAVLLAEGVHELPILEAAVREAGGQLIPILGGRAIGLFGGEAWEGDELRRAAGAALDARDSADAVAIASGRATYSGTTGIAGAALAAAERGCAQHVDGVAIDPSSATLLEGSFRVEEAQDGALQVVARRSAAPGTLEPPAITGAIIGRESELAQLRTMTDAVLRERRPMVVLISGPVGIGKSRLRWEIGRELDEGPDLVEGDAAPPPQERFRVLTGRAEQARRERAFALWESVLRARLSFGSDTLGWPTFRSESPAHQQRAALAALVHAAIDPGAVDPSPVADECVTFFAELLGVPPSDEGGLAGLTAARKDPRLMQDRIRLALEDWLAGECERGPVALLLEDLHAADEASLALVDELPTLLSDAPLFVLATARPELAERHPGLLSGPAVARILPRGLSESQVGELVKTTLGRGLAPGQVAELADRTAGNPLFVEQIVLALREDEEDRGDATLPLPLTVEAAVQSRLDHLPQQEKDLCKRAAVFGTGFSLEDLGALGVDDPRSLVSPLVRREILAPRGRSRSGGREYAFRSSLVRDVAYRMIGTGVREDLHLRAALRLAQVGGDPEEIAGHFDRADQIHEAAVWYTIGTEAAAQVGDAPTVLRCARRALELGIPEEERFAVHVACADAHEVLGRLPEQRAALDAALDASSDDAERARVLGDRAVWEWRSGMTEEALDTAKRAVALARDAEDPEVLAKALGGGAAILIYAGRLTDAGQWLGEAESLCELGAPTLAPRLAAWRAQLASARGDLVARRDAYRDAVRLYEEQGDMRRGAGAEMNLADVYNRVGGYAEAEHALEAALDKCRRLGNRLMEGYALANLGYARAMLGNADGALAALDEGELLAESLGEARLSESMRLYRARALLSKDPTAALACATAVASDAAARDLSGMEAMARALMAWCALELDRTDDALAASERALWLRDELGSIEEDEAEIFLVRARALRRADAADAAAEIEARGRARLEEIAAAIADEELARRFRTDVPAHRDLLGS